MDIFTFRHKNREEDYEDPRREFLVKALTMGAFAAGGALAGPGRAFAQTPHDLPPGQSIHHARGDIRVNGQRAGRNTQIPGDAVIETGSNSELVFVVGQDAFIMRENGYLQLRARPPVESDDEGFGSVLLDGLRLVTGALLSVFGERRDDQQLGLYTPTATIGIRGTGIYVESAPDRSYVCTCYGTTAITAAADPRSHERVEATYHEARYISDEGAAGRLIEPAPAINHTDMELLLIEKLVGRTTPFDASRSSHGAHSGY